MENVSVTIPAWMKAQAEERRPKGTNFSQYTREALMIRFILEEAGEWETPDIEPPEKAIPDGGTDS